MVSPEPAAPSASRTPLDTARLVPEALRLLRRHRSLWSLALVPSLLCGAFLVGAALALYANAGAVMDLVGGWLPVFEASTWYAWLWVGPLKLLFGIVRLLLFALASALVLLAAWLLAGLAGAPFLDVLSARVERVRTGSTYELPGSGGPAGILREAGRAFRGELARVGFLGGLWAAISLAGLLLPGGQLLVAPALGAVSIYFLPLEYAGFALDRRGLGFGEKRAWLRRHRAVTVGFGAAAFGSCLVPLLNLVMIPVLVVAGTLLVLSLPPPEAAAVGAGPASRA